MAAGTAAPAGRRRGRRRARRRQLSDINVTPLVDVMLVLLIVFMVTAPLLTTGVAVDLPRTTSSPLPGQDEPLSISVAADGKIYIQDNAIEVEQIGPRLLAISERNPDLQIFVRGDRSVDYGRIMAVVGAVNRAGFTKVALLTEPATTAAAAPGEKAATR